MSLVVTTRKKKKKTQAEQKAEKASADAQRYEENPAYFKERNDRNNPKNNKAVGTLASKQAYERKASTLAARKSKRNTPAAIAKRNSPKAKKKKAKIDAKRKEKRHAEFEKLCQAVD